MPPSKSSEFFICPKRVDIIAEEGVLFLIILFSSCLYIEVIHTMHLLASLLIEVFFSILALPGLNICTPYIRF